MATISTDTYLDGGTARTAGEVWTVNGCTFTVRTDTRWHANAPASMTGSLGNISVSSALGGTIVFDATKVRVLPFNSGSGTVPAIGTTISQGGVSGYFLGVWADWQSAPTAVGAAMPAGGWIKFREVTGGAFSAGALTGISATATSADVTGWIEVVMDASTTITGSVLGGGIQVKGDWFDLGTTNGSRGQTFQIPTNGGGASTHCLGVQIETAPGSGVYEWFPTLATAVGSNGWATANLATDARSKFVESMGNGIIRIGSDGTNNIGYLPASGCKVRVPNIFGRTVATASRATNQVPGAVTRSQFTGGQYDIDKAHFDFSFSTSGASKLKIKNCVWETNTTFADNVDPIEINNICIGALNSYTSGNMFTVQRIVGGTISNVKSVQSLGLSAGPLNFAQMSDVTISGIQAIMYKPRTGSTGSTLKLTNSTNITLSDVKLAGSGATLNNCTNTTVTGTDYIDRMEGDTTSTAGTSVYNFNNCNGVTFNGLTFGLGGTLTNTQCYATIFNSSGGYNNNVKIRNIGSRSSPLSCGSSSTTYPQYFVAIQAGDSSLKLQRCYFTGFRTGLLNGFGVANASLLVEDVYGLFTQNTIPAGREAIWRKFTSSTGVGTQSYNVGLHWADYFTSDTQGEIKWYGQSPTSNTSGQNYIVAAAAQGTGYIPSGPSISIDTPGDYIFSESPLIKGHTGFQNVAPQQWTSWTGVTAYYDLDTGSGFSGNWKLATGANLSAETVSPAGFKIRVKFVGQVNGSLSSSTLTLFTLYTTTSVQAQTDNMYPLDTNTLSFTGLAVGSEVRAYVGTDPATAVEIGGTESTSGSTFSFTHSSGGQDGFIMILAMGYQPVRIPYTYKSTDDSILIQPVIDRNYNNPA